MRIFIDTLPSELAPLAALTIVATWFGAGLVEPFQGFLAALTVLPLLYVTTARGRWVGLAAFFLPTAVLTCIVADRWFAQTGVSDDGRLVVDEVAGVCVAAIGGWKSRRWTLAVPALFSLVDRLKPWPLSELELFRPADIGVLLDDWGIGLAVAMALLLLRALLRPWRADPKPVASSD